MTTIEEIDGKMKYILDCLENALALKIPQPSPLGDISSLEMDDTFIENAPQNVVSTLRRGLDLNMRCYRKSLIVSFKVNITMHLEVLSNGCTNGWTDSETNLLKEFANLLNAKCAILESLGAPTIPCEDDFAFVRIISDGSFGKVLLAKLKPDMHTRYAVKVMSKRMLLSNHMGVQIVQERKLMACTNRCPNLFPQLVASFQNTDLLFLVMEFIEGGDCLMLLMVLKKIPEMMVRHIVAELSMAVQYLHEHKFVHRDIKPDNILITSSGHFKLADFGLCARLRHRHRQLREESQEPIRDECDVSVDVSAVSPLSSAASSWFNSECSTPVGDVDGGSDDEDDESFQLIGSDDEMLYSVVGNYNYASPEMVIGGGYNEASDWWAVGILTFHLIGGVTPFESASKDEYAVEMTMEAIVLNEVNWSLLPPHVSSVCKDFIASLLTSEPSERLGGKSCTNQALRHGFFNDVDLDSIHSQNGPFLPHSHPEYSRWISASPGTDEKAQSLSAFVGDKDFILPKQSAREALRALSEKCEDDRCFEKFPYICSE